MSVKILPAIVAGLLLGATDLASAQALVLPQYGYNYTYYGVGPAYGIAPAYPPAITFGFGVGPGVYYAPTYYNYAPAYVTPGYVGWSGWNYW